MYNVRFKLNVDIPSQMWFMIAADLGAEFRSYKHLQTKTAEEIWLSGHKINFSVNSLLSSHLELHHFPDVLELWKNIVVKLEERLQQLLFTVLQTSIHVIVVPP